MNNQEIKNQFTHLGTCVLAFLITGLAPAYGQAVSNADEGEGEDEENDVIQLSPFEVDGSAIEGYRANSTLAGTRTNMDLKDVAAAVTVVTEELMNDAGMTDINDIFNFMPSAESTSTYTQGGGDTNGWAAASNQGLSTAGVSRGALYETGMDRVRGLENATIARDYFETTIPVDTYNISTASLNRGPNSILFGLGKSSGTLNYSLKKAVLGNDFNSVTLRIGNEKMFRGSFDLNKVLYSGENETGLSVRLNGLYEEGNGRHTNTAFAKDRRLFGAVTWRPWRKTTIYANYEKSDRKLSVSTNVGMRDGITEWVNAGAPTWDPSVGGTLPAGLRNSNLRNGPYGFFDVDTWESGEPVYALQTSHNPMLDNGEPFIFAQPKIVKEDLPIGPTRATFPPEILNGVLADVHNDPSSLFIHDDEAYNIVLQQNILDRVDFLWGKNSLDAQVQIFREDTQRNNQSAFHEGFDITIDVNETLPTGNLNPDGTQEFMPNPNLYRPWVHARQYWRSYYPSDRTADQVELTYDWQSDNTWINKVTVTGLLKRSSRDHLPLMTTMVMKDRPTETLTSQAIYDHWEGGQGGPVMSGLLYVGPPVDPNDPFGSLKITRQPSTRDTYNWPNLVYYDAVDGRYRNYTGGIEGKFTPLAFGSRIRNEISSEAVVISGKFLKDRLSLIYGIRNDEITVWGSGASQRDLQTGDYLPESHDLIEPGVTDSGVTSSAGATLHVTDWISLHYNQADNFVPEGLRTDIWGNEIPQPTGEGKDYGFTFNLFENKLILKVNFYETTQVNQSDNDTTQRARLGLLNFESNYLYLQLVDQGKPNEFQYVDESGERFGPHGFGGLPLGDETFGSDAFFSTTTSFEAKGTEIELFYSPTRNWQIIANVTENETIQGSIARKLNEWIAFREPYYRTLSNWNDDNKFYLRSSVDRTNAEAWENVKNNIAAYQLNEGKVADQLRRYAARLNTTYTFDEGTFRGFTVGGGVRWADRASIGYGTIIGPDGELTLDPNQPYYGEEIFDINLFARYRTKILGIDTSFQVNVDNILDGGGTRSIVKDTSGETIHYAFNVPTMYYLTTRFDF